MSQPTSEDFQPDARYFRVATKFWSDPTVVRWDDDTKLLALYLLTCEHRTTEGLFRLPKQYIMADLEWLPERLEEPFARLVQDGFIGYDEDARVVLIVRALAYQAPSNPNGVKAALKTLAAVPPNTLYPQFYALAERYSERLHEQLPEPLHEPFTDPLALALAPSLALAPAPSSPPGGNEKPSFAARLAQQLRDEHGWDWTPPDGMTVHDSFQVLLREALERIPDDRHHGTTLGIIASYAERAQVTLTREARNHTARLVANHAASEVLRAWGQAVEWGAGLGGKYADDPLALSKYAAAVLAGGKA